jgi:hypothetical protein
MPQVTDLVLVLAYFAFWVWAVVDAAKFEDSAYRHANRSKGFILVFLLVLGVLAAIVYVVAWRPKLVRMHAYVKGRDSRVAR